MPQRSHRALGTPADEREALAGDLAAPEPPSARSDGLWALCADAQDLFCNPPPAARALFELHDCTPEGPLRAALTRFEPSRAPEASLSHEDHKVHLHHQEHEDHQSYQGHEDPFSHREHEDHQAHQSGHQGHLNHKNPEDHEDPHVHEDPHDQEDPHNHHSHTAPPSAPLGLLVLETPDASGRPLGEWRLTDARLVAARRSARRPGAYDLTVEAVAPEDQPDHPHRPAGSPGHRLRDTHHRPLGHCRDLTCVRQAPPDPEEPPIRLIGCSPSGLLRTALAIGDEELGHAKILRLDEDGRMLQYVAEGEVTAWIPSSLGRGLVDLALEPWSQRPPSAARGVWARWSAGRPDRPNLWAECGTEGRRFWLRTAEDQAIRRRSAPHAVAGRTYHLDGRHITDEPGFYCALGEAVHGPGGYFGRDADTLIDCLCGNRGTLPDPPPTLVWHDARTARACLGVTPQTARPPTFEELVTLLTRCGVETVPA